MSDNAHDTCPEPLTIGGYTYATIDLERWLPCIVTEYKGPQEYGEVVFVFDKEFAPTEDEVRAIIPALAKMRIEKDID